MSKLLQGKVSVNPLSIAIQEFYLVAKDAAHEAKTKIRFCYSKYYNLKHLSFFLVTRKHLLVNDLQKLKEQAYSQNDNIAVRSSDEKRAK